MASCFEAVRLPREADAADAEHRTIVCALARRDLALLLVDAIPMVTPPRSEDNRSKASSSPSPTRICRDSMGAPREAQASDAYIRAVAACRLIMVCLADSAGSCSFPPAVVFGVSRVPVLPWCRTVLAYFRAVTKSLSSRHTYAKDSLAFCSASSSEEDALLLVVSFVLSSYSPKRSRAIFMAIRALISALSRMDFRSSGDARDGRTRCVDSSSEWLPPVSFNRTPFALLQDDTKRNETMRYNTIQYKLRPIRENTRTRSTIGVRG
mmetsp:Transcript_6932/g.16355  ORF Transcript_6932/g.16355 Transcript_6932/m.16355 type:complete len:266 (-) Transcript_6932:789-1586(-)